MAHRYGPAVTLDLAHMGILELARRRPGDDATEALRSMIDIAQVVEALGYGRFWIAEHHGPDSPHACPEVLVGVVAAKTARIRVGAAAVLLRYYSPLKVAETFRALSALFPGRIDLGIARGPGVDSPELARALVSGNSWELDDDAYVWKARQLRDLLVAPDVCPRGVLAPEMWIHGTGATTRALARELGLPYGHALFLQNATRPEGHQAGVQVLAVSVLAREHGHEAQRRHAELLREGHRAAIIVGSPTACVRALAQLRRDWGAQELVVTTTEERAEDRVWTYSALAAAVGRLELAKDRRAPERARSTPEG
jgi:alkanesulfonate monooxygenase SsuD/methylene tetrahydromethanopterin reductase-like flavin-dependent oxidoreductase (luciferase family)